MRANDTRRGPVDTAEALREAANRCPSEGSRRTDYTHARRHRRTTEKRGRQRAAQRGSVAERHTAVHFALAERFTLSAASPVGAETSSPKADVQANRWPARRDSSPTWPQHCRTPDDTRPHAGLTLGHAEDRSLADDQHSTCWSTPFTPCLNIDMTNNLPYVPAFPASPGGREPSRAAARTDCIAFAEEDDNRRPPHRPAIRPGRCREGWTAPPPASVRPAAP